MLNNVMIICNNMCEIIRTLLIRRLSIQEICSKQCGVVSYTEWKSVSDIIFGCTPHKSHSCRPPGLCRIWCLCPQPFPRCRGETGGSAWEAAPAMLSSEGYTPQRFSNHRHSIRNTPTLQRQLQGRMSRSAGEKGRECDAICSRWGRMSIRLGSHHLWTWGTMGLAWEPLRMLEERQGSRAGYASFCTHIGTWRRLPPVAEWALFRWDGPAGCSIARVSIQHDRFGFGLDPLSRSPPPWPSPLPLPSPLSSPWMH